MSQATLNLSQTHARPSSLDMFGVLAAIGITIGYAPLLTEHFKDLWGNEQYQYFPFVIVAVGALIWSRWKTAIVVEDSRLPLWLTSCFAASAAVLLAAAVLFWSGWLAAISLIMLLGAILTIVGRHRWVTNFWGIWMLLWLLIPLPLSLGPRLIRMLQKNSSWLSSQMLDLVGIKHVMTGNVLEVPGQQFFVDEACSGIVSFMAIIAAGAIYAVWKNRRLLHVVLLLLTGVGWAFLLNVSRISIIAYSFDRFGWDLSKGTVHDILGLVLFSLSFVALVSTDMLLEFLLTPIVLKQFADGVEKQNPFIGIFNKCTEFGNPYAPPTGETRPPSVQSNPLWPEFSSRRNIITGMAVLFGLLGVLQIGLIFFTTDPSKPVVARAASIDREFLPAQIGAWRLQDHDYVERDVANEELSDHSHTFTYKNSDTNEELIFSLDYAYTGGWHDLCICYSMTGWEIGERRIHEGTNVMPFVDVEMVHESGGNGYLVFGAFDATGSYISPPGNLITWRPWSALRRRTLRTISPQLLQVQALVTTSSKMSEERRRSVRDLYFQCVEICRNHFESSNR